MPSSDIASIDIDPKEGPQLSDALWSIVRSPSFSHAFQADPVLLAAAAVRALPASVLYAVHELVTVGNSNQALVVTGFPDLGRDLPDTPGTLMRTSSTPPVRVAELYLLAVAKLLGEPFTFADLYGGRLIQDVAPVRDLEDSQTSGGSRQPLTWHVEDGHTEQRCDFFALLALRGDRDATTWICSAQALQLEPGVQEILRQPRFLIEPDQAHTDSQPPEPVAVLAGTKADTRICYDSAYMRPSELDDAAAAKALEDLRIAIDQAHVGHVLRPGELLIVDNRRAVHGRTQFVPRYDGNDRWLLRTMVCASARHHRLRGGVRAIPPN